MTTIRCPSRKAASPAFGPDKKSRKSSCSTAIRRRKRRAISSTKFSGPTRARCVARTAIVQRIEAVDARHLRIFAPREHADSPEQIGDLIVIGSEYAPHGSAAHAVECNHNVNVRLEDIDLFASNCFGFIEADCDGSTYYRCRIDRRSAADDPVKRADPRLRSLDADAFHSNDAIKGPAYLECVAKFMGDDCINIHGDYHLITRCEGGELARAGQGRHEHPARRSGGTGALRRPTIARRQSRRGRARRHDSRRRTRLLVTAEYGRRLEIRPQL